jgi:dimethylargininase
MLIAITRDVSASLGDCQLSFVERDAIDIGRAAAQHHAYRQALASLGCRVLSLPAQDAMPDAVFIEDVAVVLDEVAIMTRPGADARRAEGATVAEVLAQYRPLRMIAAPGMLDGGDVLRVGRSVYVGQSARSNASGIDQLRMHLAEFGYTVQGVTTRDCLHLKSAVTQVAGNTLLIQPEWVDRSVFAGYCLIDVDPSEPHAANALRVGAGVVGDRMASDRMAGTGVIYPACFPRTQQRMMEAGINVTAIDLSELQKAEGATTCCSLVFREAASA